MNQLNAVRLAVLFLLLSFSVQAQIIGGRASGERSPKEVGASSLSKGDVSGDVNLFNGTYGTSYTLGTVSSPGGVSFSLGLSYSSSFASGDNLPNTSGIPYGEGWNLNIPMISISTEDYNEYSLEELANKEYKAPVGPDSREQITFANPTREGELMWFAPTLSIPGVGSGRMVYKYTKRYKGEYLPVFVLHQFEKYIEAIFNGNSWTVILDDGTVYEFGVRQANQRNAQNRRTNENGSGWEHFLKPQTEVTKWYVHKISHPSKVGDVRFRYDVFGEFDLFKEFKQHGILNYFSTIFGADRLKLTKNVYQDIFLREVHSTAEKLVLDHKSLFNHNMSGVYEVDDPTVTRKDSLYTSKVVQGWGGTNGAAFNQGGSQWKRYAHLKANAVKNVLGCDFNTLGCNNSYSVSSTNPYQGSLAGISGGTTINHLVMENNDDESGAINFNHGILESPFFGQNLPSGDWYEIKSNIEDSKGLFDINLVTGDNTLQDQYLNGISASSITSFPHLINSGSVGNFKPKYLVHANTWKAKRLETIYTTLNQGIKWSPAASLHGNEITTSNYFRMPNLPTQMRGMYLQVGPANADVNHNRTVSQLFNSSQQAIDMPAAYFYEQFNPNHGPNPSNPLLHGHNVPTNFGNGMPWQMTIPIYGNIDDALNYSYNNGGVTYARFWWANNYFDFQDAPNQKNQPTLADEQSTLRNIELIHHAKNPYMLHQVSFYKLNGLNSSGIMEDDWKLIHKEQFHYKPIKVENKPHYQKWNGTEYLVENPAFGSLRNIVLLDKIQQLPIDQSISLTSSKLPTTHFQYYEPNAIGNYSISIPNYHTGINVSLALLKTIIDPLGGETGIAYKNVPIVVNGFSQRRRPKACFGCLEDFNPTISLNGPTTNSSGQIIAYKKATPYTYTFNAIVDKKTIKDNNGFRAWDYNFETIRRYDQYLPMTENVSWDKQYQTKYGYEKTTVTGPELVSGNRPYTITYQHNLPHDIDIGIGKNTISEIQGMFWGKTYKIEEYDGHGNLLSKTENEYAYSKAFDKGAIRATHNKLKINANGNHPLGHDYADMRDPSLQPLPPVMLPVYIVPLPTAPQNILPSEALALHEYYLDNNLIKPPAVSQALISAWINYYNQTLLPYYQSALDNGYGFDASQKPPIIFKWIYSIHPFPRSDYQTQQAYDAAVLLYAQYEAAYKLVRDKYYEGNTSTHEYVGPSTTLGRSYEYEYDTLIHNQHLFYGFSYFIRLEKQTKTEYEQTVSGGTDFIQTITEYSYYDADEMGISSSVGYDILLHGNTNWQELQWEPSWQLYKTKTYSPQRPDAYSESELFYYYDLINREDIALDMDFGLHDPYGNLDDGNDEQFYPIHWSWKYGMRDIAFEERVTQKAPGQAPISQSRYFDFTNAWNDIKFEQLEYGPPITTSTCSTPSDTMRYDTILNGLPCIRPRQPHCPTPNPGYTIIYNDFKCYHCWTGTVVGQNREINLGFPHKKRLFYKKSNIQTSSQLKSIYATITGISDPKYAILRFIDDGQNRNNYNLAYPYNELKTHEVLKRNFYGAVELESDAAGLETQYNYTDIKTQIYSLCHNNQQTEVKYYIMELVNTPTAVIVGPGRPDSLETIYTFNEDYTIASVTDPNGIELSYEYDAFGRMHKGFRNGIETAEISYHQWNNDKNKTFEQRTLDNYVQTKTYLNQGGSGQVARAYMDPLGRNILTSTRATGSQSNLIVAGGIDYDNWDRPEKVYKSYTHQGDFNTLVYNNHQGQNLDFAENQYEDTPRSRVLKSAKPGIPITDPDHTVDQQYQLMTGTEMKAELNLTTSEEALLFGNHAATSRIVRTATTDEDNKQQVVFTNVAGQQLATKGNDGSQDIITLFYYDSKGRLTAFRNPENQLTNYSHNLLDQLYQKETVDNGITRYVYNKRGQILYEQDAKGAEENYIRTRRYDLFGRMTRQDYYPITTSSLDVFANFDDEKSMQWKNNQAILLEIGYNQNARPEKQYAYGNTFDPVNPSYSPETQAKLMEMDNVIGLLSHTISFDLAGNPIEYRFHSYNDDGFLDWEIIQYRQEGLTQQELGKTNLISYAEYNLTGSLLTQNIDLGADGTMDLQYHNAYDSYNRLGAVYVNYTDEKANGQKVVQYEYDNALGLVKRTRYFGSGGAYKNIHIDEVVHEYDIRDRLTSLESAMFAWKLFYDDNKPPNTGGQSAWNGNIAGSQADYKFNNVSNTSDLTAFTNETKYSYAYDGINRLVIASATGFSVPYVGDANYTYDKIGNLLTLKRNKKTSVGYKQQQLAYTYAPNSNHLASVLEAGAANRQFSYDPNGNLLADTKKELTQTTYGRTNLPQVLTLGTDTTITYVFDVNDMRIGKQVDKAGNVVTKDYYLRDASGKELAVINQAEEIDWNVYGLQRVAQFRHTLPVDNGVELDIIVLLEGPTDTLGQMSTVLNGMRQILPGMTQANQPPQAPAGQPYNTAPWNYDGKEGADFTNADYAPTVVDWVLLSLRTNLTKDSEVYKTAALLHQDGHIELLTPTRLPLNLPPVYIAIEHRNHMGAISLQPIHVVNGQLTYDFTSENSYTGVGAGQKLHPKTGKWMLHAGNSANDQGYDINGVDQATWSQHNGFFGQYLPTDYNLDGDVNGEDKVLWQQNNGVYSQMEFSVGSAPRVAPTDFIYYIYDHLGNTRVAYSVDISGTDPLYPPTIEFTVTSAVDYFPYGAELRSYGQSRYLTTQHERDLETGFDYRGARFYDSEVGRFLSVDPLAEKAPSWTPYRYGFNNPIIFIDPDGMFESRREAKKHARKNKIRTGIFGKNQIQKQKDGSFAIVNFVSHSYITDLGGNLGVHKGMYLTPTDAISSEITGDGVKENLRDGTSRTLAPLAGEPPLPGGGPIKAGKASSSAAKGIRSLTKQIKEHVNKLINYKSNPSGSDNLGKLKKATPEIREKIIKGRIKKLRNEIKKFIKEREKLKNGGS